MAQFVKLLNAANYNIGKKHTIKFTDFLFFCGLISGKPAHCSVSFHSLLITSYDVDILGFRVILSQTSTQPSPQSGTKALLQVFKRVFSVVRVLATRTNDHFGLRQ